MTEFVASLLVIEDEPITRAQLTSHFAKEGYQVHTSESANGVVDQISTQGIDICLIDIKGNSDLLRNYGIIP